MKEKVKQVLLGSLLGDGRVGIYPKYKNAIFVESHSLKQKEYLLWKKKI